MSGEQFLRLRCGDSGGQSDSLGSNSAQAGICCAIVTSPFVVKIRIRALVTLFNEPRGKHAFQASVQGAWPEF
jgi:hypothetical protein